MNCLTTGEVQSPTVKLADFGLAYSQMITMTQTQHSSIGKGRGTDIYKGPESANPKAKWRTFANDVYAFSFTAIELLFPVRETGYGDLLEDSPTIFSILRLKMDGTPPPIEDPPVHWSKSEWKKLSPVLGHCFFANPSERPPIKSLHHNVRLLKQHFAEVHWEERLNKKRNKDQDQAATSQSSEKTVPISSTPQSSQPVFDFGDMSEIIFDPEGPLERTYKNYAEGCKMDIKSIGLSQNTPLEVITSQTFNMPLPTPFFPAFSRFIELCKAEKDANALVETYDATNSCTFLAVEIAMNITAENIGEIQKIAAEAGELIITGPPRYNEKRNKDKHYNIDEVLGMLKMEARVGFSCDFSHSCKDDVIKNIVDNLKHIIQYAAGKTMRIIYICPPFSFVLCCCQTCITMIDTHCVPPTEHGAVMSWRGSTENSLLVAAAKTFLHRFFRQ